MIDLATHLAESRGRSMASSGLVGELGVVDRENTTVLGGMMGGDLAMGWRSFVGEALEHVPELQWRGGGLGSVQTYHTMRNDAQVQGLFLGTTLPIRRYGWAIEPNGAKSSIVKAIATEYNIPIRGQEDKHQGRMKGRFSFKEFLYHALLSLIYGHMFFEICGNIGSDGLWHLEKLAPRMPHSIYRIMLDEHGSLLFIEQTSSTPMMSGQALQIPVNKILAFPFQREGANWAGRSMLRGMYKNWILKDTILRVGAINIERAGGVPWIEGPKGATPDDLKILGQMARQFRQGEGSGGAVPNGASVHLAHTGGKNDATNFIKLMNEEMGRAWLMMFMNLGQATTGSYALGSSLIDYVLNAQEIVAGWICDLFNENMIENHVDWNWGEGTDKVPKLVFKRTDDRQLALADLVAMVDKGIITLDEELESWIREEYSMPRRNPNLPARPSPSPGGGAAGTGGTVVDSPSTVPSG